MRKFVYPALAGFLFTAGFMAGSFFSTGPVLLQAAQPAGERLSDDTLASYRQADQGFSELADMLESEDRYRPATQGKNYFAIAAGGIDAVRDLEEGRGVDPETFAGLYAGRALPDIAEFLEFDRDGRLRYKGAVVRMYSRERLKRLFLHRDNLKNLAGSR